MRFLPYLLALMLVTSCAQEGSVTVKNDAGPNLSVNIDGASYLLDDGQSATRDIKIGRKFIFGPDEKTIEIHAEGECKFPYSEIAHVRNDVGLYVTVHGDAGYIDICNETGWTLLLYLVDCSSLAWGAPVDRISDGECSVWKVQVGCWDMRVETATHYLDTYDILISECTYAPFGFVPGRLVIRSDQPGKRPAGEMGAKAGRRECIGTRRIAK